MKKILPLSLFLTSLLSLAQVGIGTTNPTAELEIATTDTGMPALELDQQSNPTGSETGQIAVIDERLFMYDASRSKWLSGGTSLLNFGLEQNSDGQFLEYVGDILATGPRMPYDGTIVYIAANASGGQSGKQFQIYKNGVAVANNDADPTQDGLLALNGFTFTRTTYNLDFNAGDTIRVFVSGTGAASTNLNVLLWTKWRN